MVQALKPYLVSYSRQGVGFALFLAWSYYSFFSCGLLPAPFVFQNIEPVWVWAGFTMALVSVIVMVVGYRFALLESKAVAFVAALCACVGSLLVWMGYLDPAAHHAVSVIGGVFSGVGMALLTCIWGSRLTALEDKQIMFSVPASFFVAIVVYLALYAIKGTVTMVIDVALPFLSLIFLLRRRTAPAEASARVLPPRLGKGRQRLHALLGLLSLCLLNATLWSQFAYFRILSAPIVVDGSCTRSLLPFVCLLLISVVALVFCLRVTRCLNFTSMLRWGLPFILLSYVVLYLDYGDAMQKTIAYTVNFIGMFGVQFGFWVVTPKFIQRTRAPLPLLFGGLTAAQGLGIFLGTVCALAVVDAISGADAITVSLLFFAVALFVAMLVGFNPRLLFFNSEFRWGEEDADAIGDAEGAGDAENAGDARGFGRGEGTDGAGAAQEVEGSADKDITALFAHEAERLRRTYGLSKRETEVAALLLAGRSRPYIRDELVISLNTVHAHARSIYTKCGVHSQQEFMDLAHDDPKRA